MLCQLYPADSLSLTQVSKVSKSFDITFDRDLTHVKVSKDLTRDKSTFDTSQSHMSLYLCHTFDQNQERPNGLCCNQRDIKGLVKGTGPVADLGGGYRGVVIPPSPQMTGRLSNTTGRKKDMCTSSKERSWMCTSPRKNPGSAPRGTPGVKANLSCRVRTCRRNFSKHLC